MPLTIAHIAAVLPLRRLPIVLSAFVVGTMAPDFEYFVRLAPQSRWSHQFPGLLTFTFPCAVIALWIYHYFVKDAVIALLPHAIQNRLPAVIEDFSFAGFRRITAILLAITGGIATHILWDMFTHIDTPIYQRWNFMQRSFPLPVVGDLVGYKVLQHLSTLVGLLALCTWFAIWFYRTAPGQGCKERQGNSGTQEFGLVCFILMIAGAAGAARAFVYIGVPHNRGMLATFVGVCFVTATTALLVQLLIYSAVRSRRRSEEVAT